MTVQRFCATLTRAGSPTAAKSAASRAICSASPPPKADAPFFAENDLHTLW
jgi:hypothetical protein